MGEAGVEYHTILPTNIDRSKEELSEEASVAIVSQENGTSDVRRRYCSPDETPSSTPEKIKSSSPSRIKKSRYDKWQDTFDSADEDVKQYMEKYRENGYFILPSIFSKSIIKLLLYGESAADASELANMHRLRRKAHVIREKWIGGMQMIALNRELGGGMCAIRSKGRYDLPLPPRILSKLESELETRGIIRILKSICPTGKVRTGNVMLSGPGSERQPIHTDSAWSGVPHLDPIPHYITVLIPLTIQDEETGGTRIWPKSHRDYNMEIKANEGFVDTIEPILNVGDALVFDGLLSHCGMENVSNRDRYFFYIAFSNRHDPNTDSTG